MQKQKILVSRYLIILGPVIAFIIYLFNNDIITCGITAVVAIITGLLYPKVIYPRMVEKWAKNMVEADRYLEDKLGSVEYEMVDMGLWLRDKSAEAVLHWEGIHDIVITDDYTFVFIDAKNAHVIARLKMDDELYTQFVNTLVEKWKMNKKDR